MIRTLLKFRNLDLTKDINDRLSKLFRPGVFDGGNVIPVVGQLKVDVLPFKLINKDGMVVEETSDTHRLDTPEGQVTVIAVKAIYVQNNNPIVEVVAVEETVFNSFVDQDDYIILAKVDVSLGSVQTLSSHIDFSERQILDQLGRNSFRGVLNNSSQLPTRHNVLGDFYMVVDGIGGLPNLYAWDNSAWVILTDFVVLNADLTAHRNNLFPDEKHATDDEKDALSGTSGTPPDASNPFVDNADPRLPTQNENDALVGSDGSPSSTNKYVTEEYPLAVPTEKVASTTPVTPYFEMLTNEGPFFVGKAGLGSATQYFTYYDLLTSNKREYTTSTGVIVTPSGVYTDSGLTQELNPSTNPNVDADGFFTGTLYVGFSSTPDTGLRVIYGKRYDLKNMPIDALLNRSHNDAQTSAAVIKTIEEIKGRDFDTVPPVNERNIELRKDIVDLKEYISSVFIADHVVHDFSRVENVPDFSGDFVKNVGISNNYSFNNSSLIGFTYLSGVVTYSSPVALGSITVNKDVFIDGNGQEFRVVASNFINQITITKRNGLTPTSINTAVTSAHHGSIKPDNNPRQINLSTLELITGRKRILSREIEVVTDEFHPITGNIAYAVRAPLHSAFYKEPRVRFYGGFNNVESGKKARVVASASGRIMVTDFFTEIWLLVDLKNSSPSIDVYIDGSSTPTNIDLSRGGLVATLGTDQDVQYQYVSVASGLTDLVPHTVEIVVNDDSDEFIIHGFDLFRSNSQSAILPGRAFVQSDLYKSDVISTFSNSLVGGNKRGSITKRYINRSLAQQTITYDLLDFDGTSNPPAGTAVPATPNFTVTSGLTKLANYKTNDVVKLITASTEETKFISTININTGAIVFNSNVVGSGPAVLTHMASTEGDPADPTREFIRYTMTDFGAGQLTDFSTPFSTPSSRCYTVEDGTTSIAGYNVKYVTTGIDGVDLALQLDNASSTLRLRAVCSQLDLLVVNSSPMTAYFRIDGCPTFSKAIPGGGMSRIPILLNARYQSHEVLIENSAGLSVSGIILHEPTVGQKIEGTELSTRNAIADNDITNSASGDIIPNGCIAVDPFIAGGVFVGGGADWVSAIDFVKNPAFGRYNYTSSSAPNAYFEYTMSGSGFEVEFFAGPDKGRHRVLINGILATSANFPTATFKLVNSGSGDIDMYDAVLTRKKFSVTNLSHGKYEIRVQIKSPADRNPSSSGFELNVTGFYILNCDGSLSYTPSNGIETPSGFVFGMNSVRDERNFNSGAVVKEQIPVVRTVLAPTRAQRVALTAGSTSIFVPFNEALPSTDYAPACNMVNVIDTYPKFQPITVTSILTTGFTAKWNDPLDSNNYYLSYTVLAFS